MYRLPPLSAALGTWRLPLSETASLGLAEVLLADETNRVPRLAELLRAESALLLWVVCREYSGANPDGIEIVAEVLSPRLVELLRRGANEFVDRPATAEHRWEWSRLASRAAVVGQIARQLATPQQAESASLLGVLHGATSWLETSGPRVSLADAIAGRTCLPIWLAEAIRDAETKADSLLARAIAESKRVTNTAAVTNRESAAAWLPTLVQRLDRLSRLESDFQRTLEREKIAALKELAYGASHEINNPLANISLRAQTLLRDEKDPERRRKLSVINAQAFRAHEMIADLMLFAKPPALQREACDLSVVVAEVLKELADAAREQGTLLVHVPAAGPITAQVDRRQLAVAIKALVQNSLEALSDGGQVAVDVKSVAGDAEISVRDDGPGISPEIRPHIFDPFFSGREAGRGMGLGLSKCWRIVEQHGGEIAVEGELGCGAVFTIRLPNI